MIKVGWLEPSFPGLVFCGRRGGATCGLGDRRASGEEELDHRAEWKDAIKE
jgi:hypothetical protein